MKKLLLALFVICALQSSAFAQVTITAGTLTGCIPGTNVTVPISATNFVGVSSLSLILHYDPAVLQYTNYTIVDPDFGTGGFVGNGLVGTVYFAWFTLEPMTIADGTMFNMEFAYLGGVSPLSWDTANSMGLTLYQDGQVAGPLAGIDQSPAIAAGTLLYPNPSHTKVQLKLAQAINGLLEITDFNGRVLHTQTLNEQTMSHEINVDQLKPGIYFVRIFNAEGLLTECRKLLVE